MQVVETVLGNVETDPELAAQYKRRPAEEIEEVVLDERERRRSRFRTTTDAGTELGVVVESGQGLRPGDVLLDDDHRFVVVAFTDCEAVVVTFEHSGDGPAMATAARFGYRVGNRHWDLAVRGEEVLIALGTDEDRIIETVTDTLPPGAETRREYVDPTLFDETPAHGHDHGHSGHDHSHSGRDHTGGHPHRISGHTLDDAPANSAPEEGNE